MACTHHLVQHVGALDFHGAWTDLQVFADHLVGEAIGHASQNFTFASGQQRVSIAGLADAWVRAGRIYAERVLPVRLCSVASYTLCADALPFVRIRGSVAIITTLRGMMVRKIAAFFGQSPAK